jgi:hypothetical protein
MDYSTMGMELHGVAFIFCEIFHKNVVVPLKEQPGYIMNKS